MVNVFTSIKRQKKKSVKISISSNIFVIFLDVTFTVHLRPHLHQNHLWLCTCEVVGLLLNFTHTVRVPCFAIVIMPYKRLAVFLLKLAGTNQA